MTLPIDACAQHEDMRQLVIFCAVTLLDDHSLGEKTKEK